MIARSLPGFARRGALLSGRRSMSGTTSSGPGFFARLTSFLAGAGLSLGLSYAIIWQELTESNKRLYNTLQSLEKRVKNIEDKKK